MSSVGMFCLYHAHLEVPMEKSCYLQYDHLESHIKMYWLHVLDTLFTWKCAIKEINDFVQEQIFFFLFSGTGCAPFRGFLQARSVLGIGGKWLKVCCLSDVLKFCTNLTNFWILLTSEKLYSNFWSKTVFFFLLASKNEIFGGKVLIIIYDRPLPLYHTAV